MYPIHFLKQTAIISQKGFYPLVFAMPADCATCIIQN